MNGILAKKINSRPQNWISLINFVENRSKQKVRLPYCNLYAYAANNPVHYIDPDGRIQRKSDGSVIFFPDSDAHIEEGNSGKNIKVQWGYIKANDGSHIIIRINYSKEYPYEKFNCHGYTFTNGLGWVQPDQVKALLEGDDYIEQKKPSAGDIFIQYDENGEAFHSGRIVSVDEKKGTITVTEAIGIMSFLHEDGKVRKIRDITYKISEMGTVKFYRNEGDKEIE